MTCSIGVTFIQGPMMQQPIYDVIIIGAGLFGSSAARHVSRLAGKKRILLIGPSEPKDRDASDIFSAHYDEGRITRLMERTPLSTKLISTAQQYLALERQAGVQFFTEAEYIRVQPEGDSELADRRSVAKELNVTMEELNMSEARRRFPQIDFKPGDITLAVTKDCGYINPRKFIQAQQIVAKQNGCVIVDDIVNSVKPSIRGDLQQVITAQGRLYFGRRVLLATGAFTECRSLLPVNLLPKVFNSKQSYVLIEISEDDYTKSFTTMPNIGIYRNYQGTDSYFYIMRPIRYPDGKLYFKIGHGEEAPSEASSPQEIRDWFKCRGSPEMAGHLIKGFHDILPGVSALSYAVDSCVTTKTTTSYPYIDMVQSNVGVALGGCGQGAKISDTVGLIAARMILKGAWDHDFPHEPFQCRTKTVGKRVISKL
ncbi:putative sarcosine oxidase isoform X1 [Lineus longissimus]|uniref:putative sarcosine oxidase isoform X1 n=2 Tax=Lineus longissimus TaxID=88925 RepID=UPI00315C7DC4